MQTAKPLENLEYKVNSITNFLFALKAPETKRQYPKRLEIFLDFIGLQGSFEDKAQTFYQKSTTDTRWLSFKLVEFIQYQKERVQKLK